jgi:hypothetical protein
MNLPLLIFIAGLLHFGILLASALVPVVLDWKGDLAKLPPLSRQLIWVHGAFIVLIIVGFGMLAVALPGELASGTLLARAICLLIAVFWGARLVVQFFVFDAKPYLRHWFLALGYNGLTLVFLFHAIVFGIGALR